MDGIEKYRVVPRVRKPFVHHESYLHSAAKNVVADWFRASQEPSARVHVGAVWARTNRIGGQCGVYVEYPIGIFGQGVNPCWDEVLDWEENGPFHVPKVEQLAAHGVQTRCVCDVMLIHKGVAAVAIELIHKSTTPNWKRHFLASHNIELFDVSAKAVMHSIAPPAELPMWRGAQ